MPPATSAQAVRKRPSAKPATQAKPPAVSPAAGFQKFRDHFLTIVFESSVWEGKRQVKGLEATFNGEALDTTRVGKPPAALLPADLESRIRGARQQFYNAIARYTLPVDQSGTRIVPVRRLADFSKEVDEAITKFNETADAIVADYGRIITHNEDYWMPRCRVDTSGKALGPPVEGEEPIEIDPVATRERYVQTIGHLIPSRESFRSLFHCGYRFPDPSAVATRFEDPGVREFLERANSAAVAHAQDVVRMVVEEPTRRLAAALVELKARLVDRSGSKRLSPASFSEVGQAINLLLSCGDAIAPGLRQSVESLEQQLAAVSERAANAKLYGDTYTGAIREDASVLVAAIDQLSDQAGNVAARAEALERYGVAPRKLRLKR